MVGTLKLSAWGVLAKWKKSLAIDYTRSGIGVLRLERWWNWELFL
jgi:hypothetical protein